MGSGVMGQESQKTFLESPVWPKPLLPTDSVGREQRVGGSCPWGTTEAQVECVPIWPLAEESTEVGRNFSVWLHPYPVQN